MQLSGASVEPGDGARARTRRGSGAGAVLASPDSSADHPSPANEGGGGGGGDGGVTGGGLPLDWETRVSGGTGKMYYANVVIPMRMLCNECDFIL